MVGELDRKCDQRANDKYTLASLFFSLSFHLANPLLPSFTTHQRSPPPVLSIIQENLFIMGIPFLWATGVLASALALHQVLKPRLPVYRLEPILGFPRFKWDDNYNILLGVPMSVSMHNDNFMEVDVHSLTFEMFYMNQEGSLLYLSDIKDHNQASSSSSSSAQQPAANATKPPALWQIPARNNFTIDDVLYMGLNSNLLWNLLGNSQFYSNIWKGSGSFWLPTTGVAHVKAVTNGQGVPATLQIICDNYIQGLIIQGLTCVIHDAQPGWSSLSEKAVSLRSYATTKLKAKEDGSVLARLEA